MSSASEPDLNIPLLISLYQQTQASSYAYLAALTVIAHDTLLLFEEERQHIYNGRWTMTRVLYILIRLVAVVDFILTFYTTVETVIPEQRCKIIIWATGFTRHMAYLCIIKTLLVLRLRALYGGRNTKIAFLLVITMAIELAAELGSVGFIYYLVSVSTRKYDLSGIPFGGSCVIATPTRLEKITLRATTILWTTKLFSNTVEMALVLAKLYKALGDIDDNPLAGLERMRKWRPVVYVFYRDGTLFFVPLFLISFFAFLNNQGVLVSPVSWTMWLSLIYCTCGTRLILNLRVVNCKLLESSIPGQLSTIQFDHDTTQNHSSGGRSGNTFIE